MISDKQKQLSEQCRVVAALAAAISQVYGDLAKLHANHPQDESFVDMAGNCTASQMEDLGKMLNDMDAATDEDDWMKPIFKEAQRLWPQPRKA